MPPEHSLRERLRDLATPNWRPWLPRAETCSAGGRSVMSAASSATSCAADEATSHRDTQLVALRNHGNAKWHMGGSQYRTRRIPYGDRDRWSLGILFRPCHPSGEGR